MTDLSVDARLLAPDHPRISEPNSINKAVVMVGLAALASGAVALADAYSWRLGALFVLGGFLGLVLYHALFGFTSAWRVFIADGRGAGLRAQMLMLAIAVVLFFPTLAHGSLFGQAVHGEYGAVGASVLVGAFLFGIGMQLGGGCASGTLYTAGGGNTRMFVTLGCFIIGSAIGALHLPWWSAQPNIGSISLIETLGWAPALAISLAVFGAIAIATSVVEKRRHGTLLAGAAPGHRGWRRALRGPWPLAAGAVALALGNFATLYLAGRPWGVTSAFALWGSKLFALTGADVASWGYWQNPARAAALHQSIFRDVTSVMDFGIILGALTAAGIAGKFAPSWRIPVRSLLSAVIGGLLLGYGARLAYGCNIGAYFSGIVSGSLHGWLWLAAAFAGSILGTRLRPLFGLSVERSG
ncbi:YeeE/YedE family protein [Bradyrhizobium sp. STM 3562]|uniref:YeeE/YedE family protein n=1 Tax=Bradyrhizobium sp. STM 3562 TaxID=578924 RepID=UPI003890B8B1